MKTKRITSDCGRYHYKLTPNELIEMSPNGYILQVTEMWRMGLPQPHYRSIACISRSNNTFHCFSYYLDEKGILHIGCREFNKTTTKTLLRWAGLLGAGL